MTEKKDDKSLDDLMAEFQALESTVKTTKKAEDAGPKVPVMQKGNTDDLIASFEALDKTVSKPKEVPKEDI